LEEVGLEGRRIQMINISAAMGGQFAWSAAELTEEIRRLGPNPLKPESREDWVQTGVLGEEEAK
jgi:F420-non-reducing hydrogenase iron-sulfur subunit